MPSFIWLHAAVVPVIQIKSLVLCFSLHVSVFGLRYQGKTFRNPSFEWGTNAGLSEMRGQFSGVILICRVLGVEGSHSCLAVSSVFNILFFLIPLFLLKWDWNSWYHRYRSKWFMKEKVLNRSAVNVFTSFLLFMRSNCSTY